MQARNEGSHSSSHEMEDTEKYTGRSRSEESMIVDETYSNREPSSNYYEETSKDCDPSSSVMNHAQMSVNID